MADTGGQQDGGRGGRDASARLVSGWDGCCIQACWGCGRCEVLPWRPCPSHPLWPLGAACILAPRALDPNPNHKHTHNTAHGPALLDGAAQGAHRPGHQHARLLRLQQGYVLESAHERPTRTHGPPQAVCKCRADEHPWTIHHTDSTLTTPTTIRQASSSSAAASAGATGGTSAALPTFRLPTSRGASRPFPSSPPSAPAWAAPAAGVPDGSRG